MAAKGFSMSSRISRWELLERTLVPLLAEMPHLGWAHAELQQRIAEAKALEVVFEQRRADWLDVSRRRRTLFLGGDDLRARIGAALQFQFGFKSQKLAELGFRPRRDRGPGRKSGDRPEPSPAPKPPEGTADGGPQEA